MNSRSVVLEFSNNVRWIFKEFYCWIKKITNSKIEDFIRDSRAMIMELQMYVLKCLKNTKKGILKDSRAGF